MRVGTGYDVHRFGEPADDAVVILGGVAIAHSHPLLAHSDGDVLIHAICDALLGAAALGDIGQHFPDTDAKFSGVDSRELLRRCMALIAEAGYRVVNVDSTIVAQAPKMAEHIPQMRTNVAADLSTDVGQISVKATTTEKLGFTGRGEGIAVQAVVLISDD